MTKIHSLKRGVLVLKLAKKIYSELKPFSKRIEIAGSIRRRVEDPADIDIVLIPKNPLSVIEFMKKKARFIQGGEKRASFMIKGVKVELYFTTPESWGATLLAYSSEKGAAIGLRIIAKEKGLHLNQYGLFKKGKYIAGKTEKDIYKALARPWKPAWKR